MELILLLKIVCIKVLFINRNVGFLFSFVSILFHWASMQTNCDYFRFSLDTHTIISNSLLSLWTEYIDIGKLFEMSEWRKESSPRQFFYQINWSQQSSYWRKYVIRCNSNQPILFISFYCQQNLYGVTLFPEWNSFN